MSSHSIRLRNRFRWVLFLPPFLLCASAALGGVIPGRWEKVDQAPPGTAVIVETRSQGVVAGTLEARDDSSLTLGVEGQSLRIPTLEVLTVSMAEKTRDSGSKGALKGALTGAAVGAGGLVLLAALTGEFDRGFVPSPAVFAVAGAVVGGGAGALIGFGVAKARTSREVLYRVP